MCLKISPRLLSISFVNDFQNDRNTGSILRAVKNIKVFVAYINMLRSFYVHHNFMLNVWYKFRLYCSFYSLCVGLCEVKYYFLYLHYARMLTDADIFMGKAGDDL